MLICVTSDDISLSSPIGEKFGRCRYLHFIDMGTMDTTTKENHRRDEHGGVGVQVAQEIVKVGVDAVITGNVGPNASEVLNAANIPVYAVENKTIEAAVHAYQQKKLTCINAL